MSPETFAIIKSIAAGSPIAIVMMIAVVVLWKDNKAQQRCKSPEKDPCGTCQLCVSRRNTNELTDLKDTIIKMGNRLGQAIEDQESKHALEVAAERERGDALQEENKKTLRELMDFFKDSDHD